MSLCPHVWAQQEDQQEEQQCVAVFSAAQQQQGLLSCLRSTSQSCHAYFSPLPVCSATCSGLEGTARRFRKVGSGARAAVSSRAAQLNRTSAGNKK